ncbi:MAG: competence/damage-inducible protein A [Planctomycetes bacterium]|nr:competence/damage-inducible protein A [Planctomycetota bacterium]
MSDRVHRTAAVLAVGDEIVRGEKLDTNSSWISACLTDRGIEVVEHATLADDQDAIARAIGDLCGRVDLVIVTGGLGPTPDDLTRAAIAQAVNRQLIEDKDALDTIRTWFERTGRPMPELNRVQALKPEGAAHLDNPFGTAPGLHLPGDDRRSDVFCLPGPPREMKPMFASCIAPALNPPPDHSITTRLIHTVGLGESSVAERLGALMDRDRNPVVGTTASGGIVTCRLRQTGENALATLDDLEREVRHRLGLYVFGSGEQTIQSTVLDLLRERRMTLAVVESCTGGGLGATLTSVPGSSGVFLGGWITYSDRMKRRQVRVPTAVFESDGEVSRACAEAMAMGGLAESGASACVAITGIAGPSGGTDEKPVGTVWICVAIAQEGARAKLDARRFCFPSDRAGVRRVSVIWALAMLRLSLLPDSGSSGLALACEQESARSVAPAPPPA